MIKASAISRLFFFENAGELRFIVLADIHTMYQLQDVLSMTKS
jgi:hypothetical protein